MRISKPLRLRRVLFGGVALALSLGAGSIIAQSPPATASAITVDFARIKRAIPTLLFGQNLQTIERGEGIVKRDGSINQEIVALLNEAKITTLRFPGGTAADFFHWWQALGPHSRRPKQSSGYIDEFYSPVVGPDEFITIAIAMRIWPILFVWFPRQDVSGLSSTRARLGFRV